MAGQTVNSTWDLFYIGLAEMWANKSKDRSVGVGAIIVGPADMEQRSAGYNGFPRGVDDTIEERHERPLKYDFTEHAERNAIFNAARVGTPTNGCIMYLNWWPLPCAPCARAVAQSGIIQVIGPDRPFQSGIRAGAPTTPAKDWEKSFVATREIFHEAGVETRVVIMGDYDEA